MQTENNAFAVADGSLIDYWESKLGGFSKVVSMLEMRERWTLSEKEISKNDLSEVVASVSEKIYSDNIAKESYLAFLTFLAGMPFGVSIKVLSFLDDRHSMFLGELTELAANNSSNNDDVIKDTSTILLERLRIIHACDLWSRIFHITKELALKQYLERESKD